MKNKLSKILASISLALIYGCASYGSDFDISKISDFKSGVSTKLEMIKAIGNPATQTASTLGTTSVTWQFTYKNLGSPAKSKIATALFDSQDRLISVNTSESTY